METYVLTAPVFDFGKPIETIGDIETKHGIDIPIPHGFVKSVFAEHKNGGFKLWTFKIDNEEQDGDLEDFLVKTYDAEQYIGGRFWDRVSGGDLHDQKRVKGTMWSSGNLTEGKLTKTQLNAMPEKDVVEIALEMGIFASVDDLKKATITKILSQVVS